MSIPPYVGDILSQPDAIQSALDHFSTDTLQDLAAHMRQGAFDRLALTGMGGSFTVMYPAWLHLTRLPIPVQHLESGELLHYAAGQISPRTLLWMTSQSGESVEITALLDRFDQNPPAALIGMTNELDSTLAKRAGALLGLYAGSEYTVSTRTYMNSLVISQLAARQLTGDDVAAAREALRPAVEKVAAYLADYEAVVARWKSFFGLPDKLLIVGRGASLAPVWSGAMTMKEAAKRTAEGMSTAAFRHGPMELTDPDLHLVVIEGAPETAAANRGLALQVQRLGGKVAWISPREDPELPTFVIPDGPEITRPIYEILPLQLLSIAQGELNGVEPGKFRNMGKVTLVE